MRSFSVTIFLLICFFSVNGQEAFQSHFFNNLIHINPAYTGVMDESYKIGANFRSQWYNPLNSDDFRSYGFNAEMKTHIRNEDYYGLGMYISNEESGTSDFQQTSFHGAFSYIKMLSYDRSSSTYITAGTNFGARSYQYDPVSFWFGNQFDISDLVVNTNLPSGEPNEIIQGNSSGLILNIGAGTSFFHSTKSWSIYGGLGINHVNQPRYNVGLSNEVIPMTYNSNIGGSISINNNQMFIPTLLWIKHGTHNSFCPGLQFRVTNQDDDDIAFRVGLLSRFTNQLNGDNIGILTMLEYHKATLGFSYELTLSDVETYNNRSGGFELSFNYRFATVQKRVGINCPKF